MPEDLFFGFAEGEGGFLDNNVMLGRIRSFDWSNSVAGPMADWPDALKSAVRLALLSPTALAVLIGREGLVVLNDAVRDMLGDWYTGALGQPITDAFPMAADFFRNAIATCYEGRGVRYLDQRVKLFRKGAWETAWFNLGLTPIADRQANICGVLIGASETTERIRTNKALEQSQRRVTLALDAGGIVGTWDLAVLSNQLTIDSSLARLVGLSEEEGRRGVNTDRLSGRVHPDDIEELLKALRSSIATGSDYRFRYRATIHTGDIRWFVSSGRPVRSDSGRVTHLAGIIMDVTEQTETAEALKQSNLRFDILAESIPQIVWSTDADGRHDYFNRRWTEFTGIEPQEIAPKTWERLVHPDDWMRVLETWTECLATGKTYDIDYRFRHRDGNFRWLKVLALPLRDSRGHIIRWYGTATDIEDTKQLEAQREMVAGELDHRIKNLFTLVNGLLGLSVRDEPALAPVAERLRLRLSALHEAHCVVRGGTQPNAGSLWKLLHQLLSPYRTDDAGRIVMEGPDVVLDAHSVTSMALVFHELITNAAKYGALSRESGTLFVILRLEDDRQIIEWREVIQAVSVTKPTEGFGSRLLKAIVERQFRGNLIRDLSHEGLRTRIEIPQAALCRSPPDSDTGSLQTYR